MKANEAPERIYLVIDQVWGSMSVNYNRNDANNVEYTRTDAFIKKACEWLRQELVNFEDYSGMGEEFIEDFKKYMKESKI